MGVVMRGVSALSAVSQAPGWVIKLGQAPLIDLPLEKFQPL